jgi:hypothetical protein
MTAFAQFALFLSSYSPLFAVFALLDSFGSGWPTRVCLGVAVVGLLLPALIFLIARRLAPQSLRVESSQIRDGDALAYIATYLVPFAAITATTARERGALGLFVFLIAVLYVRSELFYINPLLALVGYRLFQVATPAGTSVVLLTRRRFLRSGIDLKARRLSDYVYWEDRQ